MTARLSEGGVQLGAVINLLLQDAEPFRQDPTIREFYMAHRDQLRCAWTDKRLGAGWTWITPSHSYSGRQVQPGTCFPHLRA